MCANEQKCAKTHTVFEWAKMFIMLIYKCLSFWHVFCYV